MSFFSFYNSKNDVFFFIYENKIFFVAFRIHIAVTLLHTADGMADQFISDITKLIAEIMKNPKKPVEGEVFYFF